MPLPRISVFTLYFVLFLPGQAAGQSYAVDRGSLLIDGQASVRSRAVVLDNKAAGRTDSVRYLDISINPSIRYFVVPGVAIGGELLIGRSTTSQSGDVAAWSYGIGPAVSYFFGGQPRAWYPYVGAGVRVHGTLFENVPGEPVDTPEALEGR